jgi:hypothetical protein
MTLLRGPGPEGAADTPAAEISRAVCSTLLVVRSVVRSTPQLAFIVRYRYSRSEGKRRSRIDT